MSSLRISFASFGSGMLTDKPMNRIEAYRMVGRAHGPCRFQGEARLPFDGIVAADGGRAPN